mmetsp:Transcript_25224/g.40795  ORF Transcript_25224/g.40795 Transcript_25224/m.40795 type:complete len:297 (+) Transcript_25224:312-1202(+)
MPSKFQRRSRRSIEETSSKRIDFVKNCAAVDGKSRAGEGASRARPRFPFDPEEKDHCESPFVAYEDVGKLIQEAAEQLGKDRSTVKLYDPYYCAGSVVGRLNSLGFRNVYNKCEDFYEMIRKGTTPEFDILVTNPPYSGDHVQKLLEFASGCKKPFFLLLPNYVYTKSYYQEAIGKTRVAYLFPFPTRYTYLPPAWVQEDKGSSALLKGKTETAPFPSFWYCSGGKTKLHKTLVQKWSLLNGVYAVQAKTKEMFSHRLLLCLSDDALPNEVRGELDKKRKRPNAKSRRRMKQRLAK